MFRLWNLENFRGVPPRQTSGAPFDRLLPPVRRAHWHLDGPRAPDALRADQRDAGEPIARVRAVAMRWNGVVDITCMFLQWSAHFLVFFCRLNNFQFLEFQELISEAI